MRDLPPLKFDISKPLRKAYRHMKKRVDSITINLPFVSFSVKPDDLEQKVAREIVIRLANKRVLNASECCDDCVEKALTSLQEIRSLLVDKQVELSEQTDGAVYLIVELMLECIRQFFTFEEGLRTSNPNFPGEFSSQIHRTDLEPYFAALEMLRGHLFRCLSQVAIIANTPIPQIENHMRYKIPWQLDAYQKPELDEERDTQISAPEND